MSNLVARKAISLLAEGVRDGAAARAAHDYLYMIHDGKVSAELHILSFDLVSKTIVISRNSHCPVIVGLGCELQVLAERSEPIGVHRRMKPLISEIPIAQNTTVVVFTDGALDAGVRYGSKFDIPDFVSGQLCDKSISAQKLADAILARAMELDHGRPNDDTSVLVARVIPRILADDVRRISARFPIEK